MYYELKINPEHPGAIKVLPTYLDNKRFIEVRYRSYKIASISNDGILRMYPCSYFSGRNEIALVNQLFVATGLTFRSYKSKGVLKVRTPSGRVKVPAYGSPIPLTGIQFRKIVTSAFTLKRNLLSEFFYADLPLSGDWSVSTPDVSEVINSDVF